MRSTAYHLKTDNTASNDDHLLGDLLQRQRTRACDDPLLVNVQAGERRRFTSSGYKDVLRAQSLLTTFQQVDLDLVLVDERAGTLDVIDTVLFQQELDTLCQALHRNILRLHHLLQIELDISDFDSTPFRIMQDVVVEVGVVQEGFRGDTADVQAGSAQFSAFLDTCCLSSTPKRPIIRYSEG